MEPIDPSFLIDYLRDHSQGLDPVDTAVRPRLEPLGNIRAVVFDVYGTLFSSGSGDISLAASENRETAIRASLASCNIHLANPSLQLSALFHQQIHESHERDRANGTDYPEVEIREIWRDFFSHLCGPLPDPETIEKIALAYECRVNPVWPMPELATTLQHLQHRRLPLGIVSNAQFFTPLLFPAFLSRSLSDLGFDPRLSFWSYRERLAKPGRALYERLVAAARTHHRIEPCEILYIGNDMRNDIAPASACGLRTALFAGDQRSLRWREGDPLVGDTQPDRILTRLNQIPAMLNR